LNFNRAQGEETYLFSSFWPRCYFPEYGVLGLPFCEESSFHPDEI